MKIGALAMLRMPKQPAYRMGAVWLGSGKQKTSREMLMIELVIVYCLSADTKSCQEKRLAMEDFPTPAACTMGAQQRAQEYLVEHPKYMLKSWRCEVDVPHQSPA